MHQNRNTIFLILLLLLSSISTIAQNTDSLEVVKANNKPRTAAIMSACLPGLGQIYNKKYWKLPIIYGGFAGLVYLLNTNISEYNSFKTAYAYTLGDSSKPLNTGVKNILYKYNQPTILEAKTYYKNNADLLKLLTVLLYALNIVDASVDANLKDFEIDDNLSFSVHPKVQNNYTGIGITLNIK